MNQVPLLIQDLLHLKGIMMETTPQYLNLWLLHHHRTDTQHVFVRCVTIE